MAKTKVKKKEGSQLLNALDFWLVQSYDVTVELRQKAKPPKFKTNIQPNNTFFIIFFLRLAGLTRSHCLARVYIPQRSYLMLWPLKAAPSSLPLLKFFPILITPKEKPKDSEENSFWPCKTWAAFPHMLKAGITQFNLMNLNHRGGRHVIMSRQFLSQLEHTNMIRYTFPHPVCIRVVIW